MFMFRKKETKVNTTNGLQKEAKKFQSVVADIQSRIKPEALTMGTLEGIAAENGLEVEFLRDAFETYLKNNALRAVRQVKSSSDYSVLNLEQAVEKYGFELDDLNITYFSQE
jgi:hypothetical protein